MPMYGNTHFHKHSYNQGILKKRIQEIDLVYKEKEKWYWTIKS